MLAARHDDDYEGKKNAALHYVVCPLVEYANIYTL